MADSTTEVMQVAARTLDGYFNGSNRGDARRVGFVLLAFPFGEMDGSTCNCGAG